MEQDRAGQVTICSLSNELLLRIIHFLSATSEDTRERLLPLHFTSHRFHQLTEVSLYSHFRRCNPWDVQLFLLRLLERPDLAACVKSVYADSTDMTNEDGTYELNMSWMEKETDWDTIREGVEAVSCDSVEALNWFNAVKLGNWDALTALLLSILPNLEDLELSHWNHDTGTRTWTEAVVLRAAMGQKPVSSGSSSPTIGALGKLRKVRLEYGYGAYGMSISEFTPFLRLISITTLSIDNTSYIGSGQSFGLLSGLKDLTIDSGDMDDLSLRELLKCFNELERFSYTVSQQGSVIFEPPRLLSALSHLKHCLKELAIHFTYDYPSYHPHEYEYFPIGSLSDFKSLISIDTAASVMLGLEEEDVVGVENPHFEPQQRLVESIPSTLEYLTLDNHAESVVSHIFELVSHKAKFAPSLRRINLQWGGAYYFGRLDINDLYYHPSFSIAEALALLEECQKNSVEMVVTSL